MSDSYVTSKAILKCSCGDKTSKLTVYPDRTVELSVKPTANISDHISMYNIFPFGKCHTTSYPPTGSATRSNHGKLTPMPCVPGTDSSWINGKHDYIIKGSPALLKSSYCRCKYGGVITIVDDGQEDTGMADLEREAAKTADELMAESKERPALNPEAVLDGIQAVLDAAGFVPGVGAIPDLLNAGISAIRGDWVAAGLSVLAAVPLIGDAAAATKIAHKGVKTAAKKAALSAKTSNLAAANNTSGAPFISVTMENHALGSPAAKTNAPRLGSLTIEGRKSIAPQPPSNKEINIETIVDNRSSASSEDSLKEIFKYKGNQPKPNGSAEKLDIDS